MGNEISKENKEDYLLYEIYEIKRKIEELYPENECLKYAFQEAQEKNQEWHVATRDYRILVEKMLKCESMKRLAEDNNIEDSKSIKSILNFVRLLGPQCSFSTLIYNELLAYKKNEFLTASEKNFLGELNSYYMRNYGIKRVFKHYKAGSKFNAERMQDKDSPDEESFAQISGTYVPYLDDGNIIVKAIVKGVRNE